MLRDRHEKVQSQGTSKRGREGTTEALARPGALEKRHFTALVSPGTHADA